MAGGIGSMEFLVTQILLLFQKAIDGFGFSPTEQQLINHLKSENPGRTEHFCIIPKLGNITDFDPWQLPGEFTGQSILPSNSRGWWFICSQTQNQRARITRKTPCGSSWKVTGKPRDITIDGKKIGFKKILGFPEEKAKKDWIIHEYHLPQDSPNSGNNVLCHLMHKQDEKADNSTTGSEDGKFTLLEAEQWCNQFNDEPEGISPELHTISWPQLMQLLQRELESPSIHQFTNIGSLSDADLCDAKGKKGEEPRFEMVQQENGARNIEDEAAARAKLLQHGLQSPNNSSSSPIHQFTNIGSLSATPAADLCDAKGKKGEEPRFEMVQQENGARNIEDEAAARAKLLQHGLQSPNNSSSSPIHQFTNIGSLSAADLSQTKVQKGEEPRFESFQQEIGARNIEDEVAARAKLLQHGLQSPNNSSSSPIHQFTNIGSLSAADLSQTKVQKGEEPRFEMVQQENGARNIEDEAAARAKLLQRGLQSPNNSSSSTIHQFTNIGSLSAADLSQTKVQKGEEPRFETFQQETGARNIEDEAAARAKNGQIFITANRQSIVEPLNCVFPPEERKGIPSNPFYSSGFLKFSEFEAYFDQPADQEKGLEHEEHNLAGNSPKRRRLDVSEENQIQ